MRIWEYAYRCMLRIAVYAYTEQNITAIGDEGMDKQYKTTVKSKVVQVAPEYYWVAFSESEEESLRMIGYDTEKEADEAIQEFKMTGEITNPMARVFPYQPNLKPIVAMRLHVEGEYRKVLEKGNFEASEVQE